MTNRDTKSEEVKLLASQLTTLLKSLSYGNQEDAWDLFISEVKNEFDTLCKTCCNLHCGGWGCYDSRLE